MAFPVTKVNVSTSHAQITNLFLGFTMTAEMFRILSCTPEAIAILSQYDITYVMLMLEAKVILCLDGIHGLFTVR